MVMKKGGAQCIGRVQAILTFRNRAGGGEPRLGRFMGEGKMLNFNTVMGRKQTGALQVPAVTVRGCGRGGAKYAVD
jgi:hypothetical protein